MPSNSGMKVIGEFLLEIEDYNHYNIIMCSHVEFHDSNAAAIDMKVEPKLNL
jgi:hypothetical protein